MGRCGLMDTTQIGKYEILSTIGQGSMGMVYKARDPEIGRTVAIKTLRSVFLGTDAAGNEALQRFRQESRSAGRLRHANIVTIYDTGRTENGTPFIAMEYVEGRSLESIIAQEAPLDPLRVLHYLGQIGSAIDYAHSQDVIHRDIKPSNVIIDSASRALLLDFGVAKLSDTSLTPAGTVVGTPSYMSPEQIRGESLDGGTDRFAFAVMAFEMLTGVRPFPGSDFTTVVTNIIHNPPRSFSEVGAGALPAEAEQIILKGLAKERGERFPSCAEFVAALARVFNATVSATVPLKFTEEGEKNPDQPSEPSPADVVSETVTPLRAIEQGTPQFPLDTGIVPAEKSPSRGWLPVAMLLLILLACAYLALPPDYKRGAQRVLSGGASLVLKKKEHPAEARAMQEEQNGGEESGEEKVYPANEITVSPAVGRSSSLVASSEQGREEKAVRPPQSGTADHEVIEVLNNSTAAYETLLPAINHAAGRDPAVFSPLLVRLTTHPDFRVRIAVMKVFTTSEKYKTREVMRAVIARLKDEQWLVRGFAVKILASLGNQAAVKILEEQLKVEDNPTVRKVITDSIDGIRAASLQK